MSEADQAHVVANHRMQVDVVSSKPKKVLIVVANPANSTTMGWPVGFWGAELTHPYYELTERGVEVTIASPEGGKVEMDSLSDPRDPSKWSAEDLITMGFVNTPELMALLEDTPKLADLDLDEFDAIMVAGGQSPMFTFRENEDLKLTILLRVREADRDLLPWNRRAVWSERAALSRAEDGRTQQRDAVVRGAPAARR